ncbi:MAG TPA: hypothetical protein VFU65_10630 [Actinocrinis sp.]|nr:hypothetical protein [Actinocrinis sp.]
MKRGKLWPRIGLTMIAVIAAVASISAPSKAPANPSPASVHGRSEDQASALTRYLRAIHLVNYFPSGAGWQYMWTRWQPQQIDDDFAVMAGMGANAVRITVFPEVMGFPAPSPLMQSRLAQIISMADRHGLKVQLSLFDQFTGFPDVPDSRTWLHDLLEPLGAGAGAHIAFIDLRNELDAPSTLGNPQVHRWLDALLPEVRRDAPGVPVTLSVSTPEHLSALRAALHVQPDFWDLHYYSSDGLAYSTMAAAIRAAAPRPVFVGETGFATAAAAAPPGLPAGEPSLEAYQAHYYQAVEQATRSLGLGAAAPWSLYDFSQAAIPSRQPPDQYAFGLLHGDGTPKPAAAIISRLFHSGPISDDFNSDFSRAVATAQGELPAVWRLWDPGQADFALDPGVGHDTPGGSARISGSGGSDADMPAFYTVPVQPQISPGSQYRVTAWVRGHRATGTTVVNVSWFDSQGVYLSGSDSTALKPGDPDWTQLQATGTAPPGAAFAQLWLKSAQNSGTVWFDDVTWTRWPA